MQTRDQSNIFVSKHIDSFALIF